MRACMHAYLHTYIHTCMHISRYVVDDEASEKEFPQGVRDKGRAGRRLDDFERDPQAVIAGLKKPELAALRVYTSPAFPEINDPLRDQTRFRERRPHPLPVTVALIVRALKKLRKIGAADSAAVQALTLWRGMKNVRVTDEFARRGGTELGAIARLECVVAHVPHRRLWRGRRLQPLRQRQVAHLQDHDGQQAAARYVYVYVCL